MIIYIPTARRGTDQKTYDALPPEWQARTRIVAEGPEAAQIREAGYPVLECPGDMRIHTKRQWIVDQYDDKDPRLLMLDDDLRFLKRRSDNPTLFRRIDSTETGPIFDRMFELLGESPVVGLSHRRFANVNTEEVVKNKGCFSVWGVDVAKARDEGVRFDRTIFSEDADVFLQFMSRGYDFLILNSFVHEDVYDSPGGCNSYRNPRTYAEAALRMEELWPGIVKIVHPEVYQGEGKGHDIRVAWKKARKMGEQRNG